MIQIENRWTDLDNIWYGRNAIGYYPKIVLYNYRVFEKLIVSQLVKK
jgi:hypothetical protein